LARELTMAMGIVAYAGPAAGRWQAGLPGRSCPRPRAVSVAVQQGQLGGGRRIRGGPALARGVGADGSQHLSRSAQRVLTVIGVQRQVG
jgi:hypothetical protein